MKDNVFDGCSWIGADKDCQSPVLARTFYASSPLSATIHITGLGYFYGELNGKALSDHWYQPVCSEYSPRDLSSFLYPLNDRLTHRIYYCSYDITRFILPGENRLTIQLGNGWYRQTERVAEGNMMYGDTLKAIYCIILEYPDHTKRICSDGSECWTESTIRYNNLFIGEVHDLRYRDIPMQPVKILEKETAILTQQTAPPDKVIRILSPVLLSERNGKRIFDAKENITGLVRLTVAGDCGESVELRYAENLTENGELDFASTGSDYICASGIPQIQRDICICGGRKEFFYPKFCWHGFRYFEVIGPGELPEVLVIHSDVAVTGSFCSDSEGLNFLFEAYLRSQLGNMHGSIPSDCPHRERLGYTGDGQVAAAAAMMLLSSKAFYKKWMQDILDCQDLVSGHSQHTAPLGGGGGGPVGWGGAIVVIPYRYFKMFGDVQLLGRSWEPIKKWIAYCSGRMENYLVSHEEEKGWCLGDWAAPGGTIIPEPFVNTCLFIRCLNMLIETAPCVGKEKDISIFQRLKCCCEEALVSQYYDPETGSFCSGIQGADAFAICADVGDHKTVNALVGRYEYADAFDTGFIGTDLLLEALFQSGRADIAYRLLTSEKCGSFLYMKRNGATTLWENWDGSQSHNHPMFGGCVRHLFEGFLGIQQKYGTGGYMEVSVKPQIPAGIGFMEGSILTPKGCITVKYSEGTVFIDTP